MSKWWHDWEENDFDGPEALSRLQEVPAFMELSEGELEIIGRVLFDIQLLETLSLRELDHCQWKREDLLATSPPSFIRSERDKSAWKRFRANQACVDACRNASAAMHNGAWIEAVFWALIAGNKSQEDLALIGARRHKALTKRRTAKGQDNRLIERDKRILAQAAELKALHPNWKQSAIARQIAADSRGLMISSESIRKIIRPSKLGKAKRFTRIPKLGR